MKRDLESPAETPENMMITLRKVESKHHLTNMFGVRREFGHWFP